MGYRDGRWVEVGNAGPSLPAGPELRRGETVRNRIEVTQDAQRYRALIRVVDDHSDGPSTAWIEVPRG